MANDSDRPQKWGGSPSRIPSRRGRDRFLGMGRRISEGAKHLARCQVATIPMPTDTLDATPTTAAPLTANEQRLEKHSGLYTRDQ